MTPRMAHYRTLVHLKMFLMKLLIILKEKKGEPTIYTRIMKFKLMTDILLWMPNTHKFELFCSKRLNSFSIILIGATTEARFRCT